MSLINKREYTLGETLIAFTGPIGGSSVIIYKSDVSLCILASGIGDGPLDIVLTSDIFSLGHYLLLNTTEPNGCQLLTAEECRNESHFIAIAPFSIVP